MTKENKKRKKISGMDDLFKFHTFDDMEKIMEEMRRLMLEFMEDMEDFEKEPEKVKSRVYGINITIGPEGEVDIKQFGDLPSIKEKRKEGVNVRQPLVEVHKDDKNVMVIAEIPGVEEKGIELKLEGKLLIIKAKNRILNKDYYREVQLPYEVEIKRKTYKNGILEVDMERKD